MKKKTRKLLSLSLLLMLFCFPFIKKMVITSPSITEQTSQIMPLSDNNQNHKDTGDAQ